MSHMRRVGSFSELTIETISPPQFQVQDTQGQQLINPALNSDLLDKPIVIPQSTNLTFMRFMKNLSPFARCYPYLLSTLSNPITDSEFLAFIDGLNNCLLSHPAFQVVHVTGGVLGSVQGVLPAQAVGGVLQVTSLLASAGVSYIRVRKFLKSANADIFAPRGLLCKIMTTEKMMAAIEFTEVDKKGKLKLPPLETVHDLGVLPSHSGAASVQSNELNTNGRLESVPGIQDPRQLRLQALEGYVSPLDFDVSEPSPESWLSKMGHKPLRWANNRQMKGLEKAQAKVYKKRESKATVVSTATLGFDNQIAEIDKKIVALRCSQGSLSRGSGHTSGELEGLEMARREEEEKREKAVKKIYKKIDKKMEKAYKKEEKVANKILWVVITQTDGGPVDEEGLFWIDSDTVTPQVRE